MTTLEPNPEPPKPVKIETDGISPKVYIPFVVLIVAGAVLLALGEDEAGYALLAAAIGQGGIA